MINLTVKVKGINPLLRILRRARRTTRRLGPMHRHIGEMMVSTFQQQMTRGVDPDGRPLEEVERWTRQHRRGLGKASGKMIPLVATGALRRNLAYRADDKTLVVGFRGKYAKIAERMQEGKPGSMPVKASSIRTGPTGDYIRVRSNDGQWYTKRVSGGSVSVTPKERPFFYMNNRYNKLATNAANAYLWRHLFARA